MTKLTASIDGVLLRGKKPIKYAKPALDLLNDHRVPFMLLTNGGGTMEKQRTDYLSNAIGVNINPIQLVQSHTPFKALTKFQRVLVVGGPEDKARGVAQKYGFKDVILPVDIVRADESIWPFHKYSVTELKQWGKDVDLHLRPFDAIFVFNDPRDMGSDIQIVLDLLNSQHGLLGTKRKSIHPLEKPAIPIYFSNDDLLWPSDYKLPRLGQGAFRIIVERLYQELNGSNGLENVILGKPQKVTYDFTHNALIDWRQKILNDKNLIYNKDTDLVQVVPELGTAPRTSPFKKVFMIGDNPASDILGAFNYGWDSCLVRTGVYQDSDPLRVKPTYIVDNVYEAVTAALRQCHIIK